MLKTYVLGTIQSFQRQCGSGFYRVSWQTQQFNRLVQFRESGFLLVDHIEDQQLQHFYS